MKGLWILAAIGVFGLAICTTTMAGEIENYCDDPEKSVEWRELVEKYPGDDSIQILHALRMGLCRKIEAESISFERANRLFRSAHQMVIEKKQSQRNQAERNRWN